MKKRTAPLFLAVLTACALACPALAAEAPSPETTPSVLYPVEVLEYTEGDRAEPRISKTYELSPMDDPALIPTGDFERSGCLYTLLDIVKEDQTETDSKYYTETVTLDSKSKDMEEIMPLLAATCEAVTDAFQHHNGAAARRGAEHLHGRDVDAALGQRHSDLGDAAGGVLVMDDKGVAVPTKVGRHTVDFSHADASAAHRGRLQDEGPARLTL